MASTVVSAVSKATFGLLRKLVAEKLEEGDVVDIKLRDVIVGKIDNINTKLDALAGKDLVASMSFFMDGLVYLEKVLNESMADRQKPKKDEGATQAVGAVVGIMQEENLTEKMINLQLADLNETARKNLEYAKNRFEKAFEKAVEAFGNKALSTPDRLLAMAVRIMATLLEQVEDLANALASCRLCLQELHSLSAVQENFSLALKKSFKFKFGQDECNEIIVAVCQMNRVIYDVTQMVEMANKARELLIWPCVAVGEEKVDPLRDPRIAKKLRKLGMEQFCVQPWSFGQEGEEEQRLKSVAGIAINTKGQFIIANDKNVKVFDSNGKFLNSFYLDGSRLKDVAADRDDNIYVLGVDKEERGVVRVFDKEAKLHHSFDIRPGYDVYSMTVTHSNNVLVSMMESLSKATRNKSLQVQQVQKQVQQQVQQHVQREVQQQHYRQHECLVEVCENYGRLLHRIEVRCQDPSECLISTTGDGHVMVLDSRSDTLHLFSPQKYQEGEANEKEEEKKEEKEVEEMALEASPPACFIGTTGDGHIMDSTSDTLDLFGPQKEYPYPLEKKVQLRPPSTKHTPGAMTFHQPSEQLYLYPHFRHQFSQHPLEKKVQIRRLSPNDIPRAMSFHQPSELMFIASVNEESNALRVSIYNKDGEYDRSIPLETEPKHGYDIRGIAVTNNGRIAVAFSHTFIGRYVKTIKTKTFVSIL